MCTFEEFNTSEKQELRKVNKLIYLQEINLSYKMNQSLLHFHKCKFELKISIKTDFT